MTWVAISTLVVAAVFARVLTAARTAQGRGPQ